MHWTAKWLGRAWDDGRYDCADFVVEVERVEFARTLRFSVDGRSSRAWDRQLAAERAGHAVRTFSPVDGDGVLMCTAGARRHRGYHLGVYVVAPEPHVLHCPRGGSSIVHPVRELGLRGLELEGYYRWLE